MPSIMDAFAELRDPRCRKCRYPLEEILFTALCATLCGVEDWETMVLWARTQLTWFTYTTSRNSPPGLKSGIREPELCCICTPTG